MREKPFDGLILFDGCHQLSHLPNEELGSSTQFS